MDREKVINGLHCCSHTDGANCIYCPYDIRDTDCTSLMSMDVLELLKEQEAVEPIPYHRSDGTIFKYECRQCRTKIFKMDLFCRHCGMKVKWDE